MKPWNVLALPALPLEMLRNVTAPLAGRITITAPPARDKAGLLQALAEAEIVLGDYSGELVLDAEAVKAAPKLAFVQQPSVGVDGHDLDALREAGVPLANTAGVSAVSVAEWALAATLALTRKLVQADAAVRNGEWPQLTLQPRELSGSAVGIVGYGPIAREAGRLFEAFGCTVSYWSRTPRDHFRPLGELIATSDVVIAAIALSDQTRGLVDPAAMKPGAILVNVARGGVVKESGMEHLGGAAMDVFETEPLPAGHPLTLLPNTLLSPHVAGVTPQATMRLFATVLDNLAAALEGRPVSHVVNGASPQVERR
ncbi:NAD(P)-dependent oxidoreductase [Nonomuraea soli]|uniref:D-3-phosphoglycerate dehydrogenase n=1 Tax=Nonomuraea soli TaxID=1032476 RepID=A0A7W0HV34_9ACTN|nr:NAD(P)-dependent oxidoreductase [Nonomuraea soli]MBA2896813.1 D-3-phosphoglycerate dehydrogenase [Nonomuraea soli]